MNLAALRSAVRDLTGFRMSSLVSDARIDDAVNEAYARLCAAESWSWLVSSSTATVSPSAVSMPLSGCRHVLTVTLDDGNRRLLLDRASRMSPEWLDPAGSTPALYAFVPSGTLQIQPVPDKAYTCTVQYISRPASMASTDAPVFNAEYHMALAYAAAASLLVQENDETNRPQAYLAFYADFLDRLRIDDNRSSLAAVQMGSKPRARSRRYLAWGR